MTPSDWVLRQAIQALIAAVDTNAVVLPKFILDVIIGENANQLKPETGVDAGRIHGWMIGDATEQNKRIGSVTGAMDDSVEDNLGWRLDSTLTYPIWGFHFYQNGDESLDTDSTKLFADIWNAVVEKFARKPRLGISGTACGGVNQVKQHHELQATDKPDIVKMGNEWAHFRPAELTIDLYRTPTA